MSERKVLDDWLIATQETIAALQTLVLQLDMWRIQERADPADFAIAIQQLQEAGLLYWANEAGGHGLLALAEALQVEFYGEIGQRL